MTRKVDRQYSDALLSAKNELIRLLKEQEDIDERAEILKDEITRLRRVIAGLSDYCGVPNDDWRGMTEVCAEIMEAATKPMDARAVLDAMTELGADFHNQKNAAASVTSTLNRLANKGKIQKKDAPGGILWIGPKAKESA